jgi:hypothetical protein
MWPGAAALGAIASTWGPRREAPCTGCCVEAYTRQQEVPFMRVRMRFSFASAIMSMLLFGLLGVSGCSSDDDSTKPNPDNVAPVVVEINPDGGINVGLNQTITIEFSEAMDEGSAAGNIALTNSANVGVTWSNDHTLVITHDSWNPATQIALTVGTGLKDKAGNHLPQEWHASFWTASIAAVLLMSQPEDGATDVLLNVSPKLLFSQPMDLVSLRAATTITEAGGKVVPAWDIFEINDSWYRIEFAGNLTATTLYTIAVSTDAMVEGGSEHLSQAVAIDFTTGAEADNDPPYIDSVIPPGDSIGVGETTIAITFNEPINPEGFLPSRMSAQLMPVMVGQPEWSLDQRTLTLFLRPPLPSGVRLFAVFEPGDFKDFANNSNAVADSISLRVTGTADYFPVHGDWEYQYVWLEQELFELKQIVAKTLFVTTENIDGNTFDWVARYWDDFSMQFEVDNWWLMRKTSTALRMRGFRDDASSPSVMFSPEVLYQSFPLAVGTWDGSSTASLGSQIAVLDYDGEVVSKETYVEISESADEPNLVFEDVWMAVLNHEFSTDGEVFSAGADTLWYAPGIGVIRKHAFNMEDDDGVSRYFWDRWFLKELNIGD